jgi:glycosyltransferase involved in cell wall biosynthesis
MLIPFNKLQSEYRNLRVAFLTWEFPPLYTGGLGMACYGLVKSLLKLRVKVLLLLPTKQPVFFHLLEPSDADQLNPSFFSKHLEVRYRSMRFRNIREKLRFLGIIRQPHLYTGVPDYHGYMEQIQRASGYLNYSLIHAHDWLTFQAAVYLKSLSRKPLICHVHSTEFDRSAERGDALVYSIEQEGLRKADRAITVSHLTASRIENEYSVDPAKIRIIHNAYHTEQISTSNKRFLKDPVVLFLGRITRQKGPQTFLEVARRVIKNHSEVRFIMAGEGDMQEELLYRTAQYRMGTRFLFTGFLNRRDVAKMLSITDILIAPSLCEPFGITVLEAMGYGIPVIVSTGSGVAEIVQNMIQIDSWDIEGMAKVILDLLKKPHRRKRLGSAAAREVRKISWDGAGRKLKDVYMELVC